MTDSADRGISPDEFFATRWPSLVPAVRATLAKAGVSPADRDDLVQETATRLFTMWERIDWDRPTGPLACRIALNSWRDQWRRYGDRELVGNVPEQPAGIDTERAALARVEVGEVARALATLSPDTAQVLRLAARDVEGEIRTSAPSASARMARTRARRALATMVKVASGIAAALALSGRWLSRSGPATALSLGMVVSLSLLLGGSGRSGMPVPPPLHQPLSMPVAVARSSSAHASVRVAARATARPRPTQRPEAHRPSHPDPSPYVVPLGPVDLGVLLDVNAFGDGVRVQKPADGEIQPVCTYGSTPELPVVPRC
jgi:DNA-directed RNA polymerase specialized sigma24 family protein